MASWYNVLQVQPHCSVYQYFIAFYGWIILLCMDRPLVFIHSSVRDIWVISSFWLWGIMLLWTFAYKFLCGHMFSFLLATYLGVEFLGHICNSMLNLLGKGQTFPKQLYHFTSPSAVNEGSSFSTSSPTLAITSSLLQPPYWMRSRIALILICVSNDGQRWWASLHVPLGHLYVFFVEMPIQIPRPFDGERTVFSTNSAGKTGPPHAKECSWTPIPHRTQKLTQTGSKTQCKS